MKINGSFSELRNSRSLHTAQYSIKTLSYFVNVSLWRLSKVIGISAHLQLIAISSAIVIVTLNQFCWIRIIFFSRKNNVTFGINLSKEKKQASTWALNFKVLPYSTINIIDVSSSTTVKAQYPELNFIRANNVLEFMKKFSMDLEF